MKIIFDEKPANIPPIVWLIKALLVNSRAFIDDIIAMCVDKYPLQHITIDVNTARSFAVTKPFSIKDGINATAAPALPRDVITTDIDWDDLNPNIGFIIKWSLSPTNLLNHHIYY